MTGFVDVVFEFLMPKGMLMAKIIRNKKTMVIVLKIPCMMNFKWKPFQKYSVFFYLQYDNSLVSL